MTEAELTKHLDDAEKSPKQIAAAVLGLPEKTLRHKLAPDKWCILGILRHLADILSILKDGSFIPQHQARLVLIREPLEFLTINFLTFHDKALR